MVLDSAKLAYQISIVQGQSDSIAAAVVGAGPGGAAAHRESVDIDAYNIAAPRLRRKDASLVRAVEHADPIRPKEAATDPRAGRCHLLKKRQSAVRPDREKADARKRKRRIVVRNDVGSGSRGRPVHGNQAHHDQRRTHDGLGEYFHALPDRGDDRGCSRPQAGRGFKPAGRFHCDRELRLQVVAVKVEREFRIDRLPVTWRPVSRRKMRRKPTAYSLQLPRSSSAV